MTWMHPITVYTDKHPQRHKQWKVGDVLPRRARDGSNTHMPAGERTSYPFQLFMRYFAKAEENTKTNREDWGNALANNLTKVGHHCVDPSDTTNTKYKTPQTYKYQCDSADDNTLKPISEYIIDSDVVTVARTIYSDVSLAQLATDDATMASFFGSNPTSIQRGKDVFNVSLNTAENNDSSSVSSNPD
jgi:hypothetical protein